LPGSVAWPWKGGEFKAGRVAEVAAWRPAANRAERAALPELSMRPVGEPSEPRGLHFDIALEKQDAVAAAVVERVEAIPPFSHDEVIKEIHKAAALCNVGVLRDDQMDEIGAAGDRRSSSPKQDTYVDAVRRLHFENLNPGTTAWAEQVGEMIDKGHDPANAYRGINRTIQNDALIEQVKARALTGEILPPIINADEGPFAAIERLCQTAALKTIEPAQTARQPWYRVPYWELACPPVNWLVEGKIPRLLGLIHGQTHEGKTFVALNLIHCLTVGGNFCGVDVKPIADNEYVLYASFEDWAGVHVRLDALYGPDGELNKIAAHKLIVFPDYEANGGGADSLLMVVKAIEELRLEGRRCVLLVLDTLASSELIIKENDNDESIRLFNLLRRIMRSYQMAVLPIAHQSKSERDRDPEHRQSRGAGSKDGAVDFSLSVDRGKVSWSKLRGAPRPLPQQFDIVDNKLVWSNITAQSVRTLAPTALELGASFMACTSPVADPSNVKELTRLEVTNATRNMIAKYLGGNHTNELMTGAFLTTKAAIEFAIDRWIVTSGYGNGTVADLLGNLTASRAAKSVGSFVILDAIMFAPPVPVVSVQLQPMIPFMPPFKPFKT
jgi:hypothetical protein